MPKAAPAASSKRQDEQHSYQPDGVEKELSAARNRLTGKLKDSYTRLVLDVVIPGAKKDHIAAVANR